MIEANALPLIETVNVVCVDWKSALMLITDADTDEHLQLLDSGVLKQLVDDKWKTFAKVRSLLHFHNVFRIAYT